MEAVTQSLVIPVYNNESSLPELLAALQTLAGDHPHLLEVVFVVDGSPDQSYAYLKTHLPSFSFASQLIAHSRNFGSFAAVRTGLAESRGDALAVMAADLQESPELIRVFFKTLQGGEVDVVLGVRRRRADPWFSRTASALFWSIYRRWVQPEMPSGGIDVFAITRPVRDALLALPESNTTLVGLLLWVGFRRAVVPYDRQARRHGASSWSFRRKSRYVIDSLFAFSDLPILAMLFFGTLGMIFALFLGVVILTARLTHHIAVPGYAATVLTVIFFGGLNSLGLGLLGSYLWRTFENTKARPSALILSKTCFDPSVP